MSRPITVVFEGNEKDAVRAFDNVGDSSKRMSKKVDDSATSHVRLGEKVGNNEQNFMGAADLLDGLGATVGINTTAVTGLARGLGDLSGGFEIVSGIIPGITGLFPKLAGAMTFISAHPLMIGLLVGGAIIAGLILLEKKFGVVSGAIGFLGDAFSSVWHNAIRPAINFILGGVEALMNAMTAPIRLFSRLPGVPDFPRISIPRLSGLDVGGTVLQTGIAVVHRGEVVSPATESRTSVAGGTINVYVTGSVVSEMDLIDAIHNGLLKKQNRGNLGFRAA